MAQDLTPLRSKYIIYRRNEDGTQGEEITEQTFLLRPHDPHARVAMKAYADSVEATNPQLAAELRELATFKNRDGMTVQFESDKLFITEEA